MEYDDKAHVGHFSRHMIPMVKNLVKKQAQTADNSKCWAGLYYGDIQPLTYQPEPAIMPFIRRYITPKLKNDPATKPANQVTIEDGD